MIKLVQDILFSQPNNKQEKKNHINFETEHHQLDRNDRARDLVIKNVLVSSEKPLALSVTVRIHCQLRQGDKQDLLVLELISVLLI